MLVNNNKIFHRRRLWWFSLPVRQFFCCCWEDCVSDDLAVKETYAAVGPRICTERERSIKAARGRILDRNQTVIADNKTVCTISVIHNQVEDKEAVIQMLCRELGLSEEYVRKRVEKYCFMERIQSNVRKAKGIKSENMICPA